MASNKVFSFDAESFNLADEVIIFLQNKSAITLDFGSSAYLKSGITSSLFGELLEERKNAMVANDRLRAEIEHEHNVIAELESDKAKLETQGIAMKAELQTLSADFEKSKVQLREYSSEIDSLKSEITRLRSQIHTSNGPNLNRAFSEPKDFKANQNNSLNSELRTLRVQHAEAIASVKILEQENNGLCKEIEKLQNQIRQGNAAQTPQRNLASTSG